MSYQVLARKWRPANFDQLVGQAHVLRALTSALDNERLHHAYLFTGTRGVGKTTIARILARCLNCEQGISAKPCGDCTSCTEISEGRFIDLIEVDAASRTKVEDTRELLENVQYRPTRGRYKVYLIDEVHMLSNHSFNALLKTLEEPPPHVVFLLATTDPQKLPATVLSRCLQFHLKNMQPVDISDHLAHILEQETIEFESSALQSLSWSAKGSMRDALSLLDQAIAFGNGKVLDQEVREMLGTIDRDQVYRILTALAANDGSGCMAIIDELSQFAPDYEDVLAELLTVLHRIALLQQIPGVSIGTEDQQQIEQLSEAIPAADVQLFYQLALHGRRDLPLAPDKRSGFEMCMLRLLSFRPVINKGAPPVKKPESSLHQAAITADVASVLEQPAEILETLNTDSTPDEAVSEPVESIEPVEQQFVSSPLKSPLLRDQAQVPSGTDIAADQLVADPVVVDREATVIAEISETVDPVPEVSAHQNPDLPTADVICQQNWHQVIGSAAITGVTEQMAMNSQFVSFDGENFTLSLVDNIRSMLNPEHLNKLTAAINDLYNSSYTVTISELTPEYETPRQRNERINKEQHQAACENLSNDPQIQGLLNTFEAKLDQQTVETIVPE